MGKKKKKKDEDYTLDDIKREYMEELEIMKAKNAQLDGMIRELKVYLNEIKKIRDGIEPNKILD